MTEKSKWMIPKFSKTIVVLLCVEFCVNFHLFARDMHPQITVPMSSGPSCIGADELSTYCMEYNDNEKIRNNSTPNGFN